jgi:hypothetical protein
MSRRPYRGISCQSLIFSALLLAATPSVCDNAPPPDERVRPGTRFACVRGGILPNNPKTMHGNTTRVSE